MNKTSTRILVSSVPNGSRLLRCTDEAAANVIVNGLEPTRSILVNLLGIDFSGHFLFIFVLSRVLELGKKDSQEQVQEDNISNSEPSDKEGNRSPTLRSLVIIHWGVPILTNHDDKDSSDSVSEFIKVQSW